MGSLILAVGEVADASFSVWVPLITGLLGGVIALGGALVMHWFERRALSENVTSAILAEIESILKIIELRQYLKNLEQYISLQQQHPHTVIKMYIGVKYNYFEVYQSNTINIGMLPESISKDVVLFYALAKALLEDLTIREILDEPETLISDQDKAAINLEMLNQQHQLLSELCILGNKIVKHT